MDIRIIGTSHISRHSIREIRTAFDEYDPDIVAVELDQRRYAGLRSGERRRHSLYAVKQVGVFGYLFALVGGFLQQKLGRIANIDPGAEMLAAVKLTEQRKKHLYLIDRDILVTLQRLSKGFRGKERWRLFLDIFTAPFSRKCIRIDLTRVPEQKLIHELLSQLRDRYPSLYRVLVHERNLHMAAALTHIIQHNPGKKVLAVVGAGHEEELRNLLVARLHSGQG